MKAYISAIPLKKCGGLCHGYVLFENGTSNTTTEIYKSPKMAKTIMEAKLKNFDTEWIAYPDLSIHDGYQEALEKGK